MRARRVVWWGLLLAPYLTLLAMAGIAIVSDRSGHALSSPFRETLISVSGGWMEGSTLAVFVFPSAWILERIMNRRRSDSERFRLLALQITVVCIYVLGTGVSMEKIGYLSEESAIARALKFIPGIGEAAAIPLLVVWAAVAFRQFRGRTS